MTSAVFLGTGNFLAPARYWNSFVLDGRILVEPAPTVLPHLRRCGVAAGDLDVIVISHFHADHTFGWPFLLLEVLQQGRDRPLFVVGPPDVEGFLADMMTLGGVPNIHDAAHAALDVRYVHVDGSWQHAAPNERRATARNRYPSRPRRQTSDYGSTTSGPGTSGRRIIVAGCLVCRPTLR